MADTRHKPVQVAAKPETPKPQAAEPKYSRALLELFLAHAELELYRATARNDTVAMRFLGDAVAKVKEVLT